MKKVILNKSYGGFEVSKEAYELYAKKKGLKLFYYDRDGKTDKYRYAVDKGNLFVDIFTKDFGNNVIISDENFEKYGLYLNSDYREDSILIEVVEELEEKASGCCGRLVVVEIPDDLDYVIDKYDGIEILHQKVKEW